MTIPVEQKLISSVLRNGDLPTAFKRGVSSKMFHIYPKEWRWIEEYYLKYGRTPQKEAFKTANPSFTIKVVDETEFFCEAVKDEHKIKSILGAVSDIIDHTDTGDGDGALTLMHNAAMKISSELGLINDGDIFSDNEDILKELQMRKERYDKTGNSGIPMGFPTFDERTGGAAAGEFHLIAARTGVGKSWGMQNWAAHAALCGYKVQYDALEQPRANVLARVMSLISPKTGGKLYTAQNLIRGRDYDAEEFHRFMRDLKDNVKGKLHVADGTTGKITTTMIAEQIERNRPDIVFVDHITLMGKRSNDWQGVGEVADELTYLANRYEIPIVSGAQLNRQGAQKGSGPETIAEADKIGQDASGITIIEHHSPRVLQYHQVKYRNGSGGWGFWTKFNPDAGEFREISFELAQELIEEDRDETPEG